MLRSLTLLTAVSLLVSSASAQRQAPAYARTGPSTSSPATPPADAGPPSAVTARGQSMLQGQRPAVLLTGYWPPTNEMLRRFSDDPVKNPQGWIGSDWQGRGYDVYAYFPEFNPPNCGNCGQGMGDLEVDYQDTVADFDLITNNLKPIAIITFSRGFANTSWEVESNQYNRLNWIDDFTAPFGPDMAPPDPTLPNFGLRLSALPVQRIVDDVDAAVPGVTPAICESGNGGGYLSEFIAYLGVWYQARNLDPLSADWCVAAGHVHVGSFVTNGNARMASRTTLGTVLDNVSEVLAAPPMLPHCDALPNSTGAGAALSPIGAPSISSDMFELVVQRVPDFTGGLLFYGPSRASLPFGNGLLCITGGITRVEARTANVAGAIRFPFDFTSLPLGLGMNPVTAGSTWSFQVWFRDAGTGAGFNTSNAVEITFVP